MSEPVAAKVLVVEDNRTMLALMQYYLSKDFTVFLARSAEEALELLQREQLHAVVSDQNLGDGLMGVDLLKKVAELQPHAARILVTASQKLEDAQKAINEARVNHFLTKPFTEQELKNTVGQAVHNAALVQIRDKMVQELKEQLGLRPAKPAAGKPGTTPPPGVRPKTGDARPGDPKAVSLIPESERLAFRDGLTGLYNHRYFQEALSAGLVSARRREQKLALVLIDIDGFRRFNLSRGYAEGDKLLRRVAHLVNELMEDPVTHARSDNSSEIAARYDWDVFGVVLCNADLERARAYAEKLRKAVEELDVPEGSGEAVGEVTVTAAVAVFPDHARNEQELISAAENALRGSKSSFPNRVVLATKG
ncbi:diguanylate cyclase [Archangium violaceum]|uniref:GGDEF domain-containing response regulator n=1 Tax=Archangium violaceum TaxID=83451 RepID=UPI001951C403|nr:diguanylate cyclase [Archangium violaceum]QRN95575.1 diguanylate cyclase [Archangium violaceum]